MLPFAYFSKRNHQNNKPENDKTIALRKWVREQDRKFRDNSEYNLSFGVVLAFGNMLMLYTFKKINQHA